MVLINAIVRREKVKEMLESLEEAGFFAFSKWQMSGRGKQKGVQVGDFFYEEMPKEMLYIVVSEEDKNQVIDIIMQHGISGKNGNSGDGKIFVVPVVESYTISSQEKDDE